MIHFDGWLTGIPLYFLVEIAFDQLQKEDFWGLPGVEMPFFVWKFSNRFFYYQSINVPFCMTYLPRILISASVARRPVWKGESCRVLTFRWVEPGGFEWFRLRNKNTGRPKWLADRIVRLIRSRFPPPKANGKKTQHKMRKKKNTRQEERERKNRKHAVLGVHGGSRWVPGEFQVTTPNWRSAAVDPKQPHTPRRPLNGKVTREKELGGPSFSSHFSL